MQAGQNKTRIIKLRHCYKNFQESSVTQPTNALINGTEMQTTGRKQFRQLQ